MLKGDPFEAKGEKSGKGKTQKAKAKGDDPGKEKPVAEKKSTPFVGGLKLGAGGVLLPLALPIGFFLACVFLATRFSTHLSCWVIFLIANGAGLSTTAFGLIPEFPWALPLVAGMLLVLAIDDYLSLEFRAWRFLPVAVGAFFLGNVMTGEKTFLMLGKLPLNQDRLLPFQLGFYLAILVVGCLIALFATPDAIFRLPLRHCHAWIDSSRRIGHFSHRSPLFLKDSVGQTANFASLKLIFKKSEIFPVRDSPAGGNFCSLRMRDA